MGNLHRKAGALEGAKRALGRAWPAQEDRPSPSSPGALLIEREQQCQRLGLKGLGQEVRRGRLGRLGVGRVLSTEEPWRQTG